MPRKTFDAVAYLFFDRRRSLIFCSIFVVLSIVVELRLHIPGLFSCSGAIVSIAGLFLNIKHSLHFHLRLSKSRLYNMLAGAAVWGSDCTTPEQERWVVGILKDEMFGVAFMIAGTLIWAYGAYLMPVAQVACK